MAERENLDRITDSIIGAAIEVHRALGPGLLGGCSSRFGMYYTPRESAYEVCLAPIHQAQLLSYLKLSGCKVGLLINFNVEVVKDSIRRVVNDFPDSLRALR
jgi:hypothetical protein